MCRFVAYLGHPILISKLVTEPAHSLIHQSYSARERPEPLNGDGFGVAWFAPEISPRPALFKDTTPAWNNDNLREIARITSSRCILAHVRAASPESSVHRLNCHPFAIGNLAFMHNGYLAGFKKWRRALLASLSDEGFESIKGSTDSEHAFALLWDVFKALPDDDPAERLCAAVTSTIERLEALKLEAGVQETSYCNFAVSDGEVLVATRYSSGPDKEPASLHFATGRTLRCEDGRLLIQSEGPDPDVALIASEETTPGLCWNVVPGNHLVIARHPGLVEMRPLALLPSFAAASQAS